MRLTLGSKIGIVGAGLIGRAWAIVFARGGALVAIFDPDPNAMAAAPGAIRAGLEALAGEGLLEEMPAAVFARIDLAKSLAHAVAGADYVQESTVETLEAKRQIFAEPDRPRRLRRSSRARPEHPRLALHRGARRPARCLGLSRQPPHLVLVVEPATCFSDPETVRHAEGAAEGGRPGARSSSTARSRASSSTACRRRSSTKPSSRRGRLRLDRGHRQDRRGRPWSALSTGPVRDDRRHAPGGVRDYVRRYAASIHRLAEQQAEPRVWKESLVDRIEAERRRVLPADKLAERAEGRDGRRRRHRRQARAGQEVASSATALSPPSGGRLIR